MPWAAQLSAYKSCIKDGKMQSKYADEIIIKVYCIDRRDEDIGNKIPTLNAGMGTEMHRYRFPPLNDIRRGEFSTLKTNKKILFARANPFDGPGTNLFRCLEQVEP